MAEIIPFQFENASIRVVTDERGEPLFVGKDICDALGFTNHNKAMTDHCKGVTNRYPIADSMGRMQEMRVLAEPDVLRLIVNCTLPAAESFERLVFEEILPTIRRTGSYTAPSHPASAPPSVIAPTKEFRALFAVARLIGLDKNAATISANQGTLKLTGANLLGLLGQTHLEAEQQVRFFTPTELGARLGVNGRKFNLLLAEVGLQAKRGEAWVPLAPAEGFFRLFDTGKKHGDGTMVQQMKWAENVLALVKNGEASDGDER